MFINEEASIVIAPTVYCVFSPDGHAPKKIHSSFESAKEEAKRLATKNPNRKFYIMKSHSVFFNVHEPKLFYGTTG